LRLLFGQETFRLQHEKRTDDRATGEAYHGGHTVKRHLRLPMCISLAGQAGIDGDTEWTYTGTINLDEGVWYVHQAPSFG
jgi:hypothetical protein